MELFAETSWPDACLTMFFAVFCLIVAWLLFGDGIRIEMKK